MQEQEDSWSMDSKKRIVFYEEWYEVIDGLPQKEKLEAYEAVFRYAFYGIMPENKVINAITALMRVQVDRDKDKWEETQKKRSIAGKIGGINSGASRRKKIEASKANASFTKQTETNEAININIDKDININRDININNNNKEDVVVAEEIPIKKKSKYFTDMIDANRLSEYLRNESQSWKEVACMQLGLNLDELDRAFDDYQREVQAQGKTEEEERQIKPHFMNLIRIKINRYKNESKGNSNRINNLDDLREAVQAGRRMAEQN